MPWGAQTWGTFFKESSYGVFNAAGASLFPVLHGANNFTVRRVPQRQVIRTADAGNRPRQQVANRQVFAGTLNTLFYPSQAPYWATALTLVAKEIPSYSLEYWDSVRAWKLLGGKVQKLSITSNAQQDYCTLSVDWIFQANDDTFTTFAEPAESSFPTEVPYCHVETASNFKVGVSPVVITKYKNINVSFSNVLFPTWDENPIITALMYCGRDLTFNFTQQYTTTANRLAFEAQTAQSFLIAWVRGANNFTIDCEDVSYYTNCADDLPLDGAGYQSLDVQPFFDLNDLTDFAVTAV
jgi:hypothetical protein